MFLKRGGWAGNALALFVVVVIAAGCAPNPQPPQAGPAPTKVAASEPAVTRQPAAPTEPASANPAPSLDGTWEGAISVGGQDLGIKLNLQGQGGTIDIPAQGAKGIPIDNFSVQGNQLKFEMLPKPRTVTFTGTVEGEKMGGAFEQAGYKGTWSVARPAEAGPKNYKDEEISFKNGQVSLAGTLSLPNGAGPHPALVLISGSGAQNRDEEIFGFKPFAILADALANNGIAVLRYDDRGVGGSSKGTDDDTSVTYAADVSAAIDYLKARKEIDPAKIGLLGHSEGGVIAPMVAVDRGDVAFLVLFAGPGIPGKQVIAEQAEAILKASGTDEATVARKTALETRVLDSVVSGQGIEALKADLVKEFKTGVEALPEDQRKQLGDIDKWAQQNVEAQLALMQGPWMKFFLTHDPAPVLEKVQAPVLALFGGKDVQVVAATNEPAVKAALQKGGNKDFTTKTFPQANHLFQAAQTGGPNEYTTLKPEFAPGVIDTINSWVVDHTK